MVAAEGLRRGTTLTAGFYKPLQIFWTFICVCVEDVMKCWSECIHSIHISIFYWPNTQFEILPLYNFPLPFSRNWRNQSRNWIFVVTSEQQPSKIWTLNQQMGVEADLQTNTTVCVSDDRCRGWMVSAAQTKYSCPLLRRIVHNGDGVSDSSGGRPGARSHRDTTHFYFTTGGSNLILEALYNHL